MDTPIPPTERSGEAPHTPSIIDQDIQENKDIAAFSYFWIMSVIVYVLKRESPFVRFHSKQAIILFVLTIVVWLIPFTFIARALELVLLAGMVIGFLGAAQGQWKDVPFVGPLSRREKTIGQTWHELVQALVRIAKIFSRLFRRAGKAADTVIREHEKPVTQDPSAANQQQPLLDEDTIPPLKL